MYTRESKTHLAIYQIDIEKEFRGEFWTNVYHVQATLQGDALAALQDVVAVERELHYVNINFTKGRCSQPTSLTAVGVLIPLGGTGAVGQSSGLLPLFNTVNVVFTSENERANRKYYRGALVEDDITFTDIRPVWVANVTASLQSLLSGPAHPNWVWVTKKGGSVNFVQASNQVGMRQLRRGSRRRRQPVL